MDKNEFKNLKDYLLVLKNESKVDTEVKTSAFYTVFSTFVKKYPKALFRDNLEIDKTFAIVLPKYHGLNLVETLELYLDTKDILEDATYRKVKNTGFITLEDDENYMGFWVLVE